jgi:hypothetical protein
MKGEISSVIGRFPPLYVYILSLSIFLKYVQRMKNVPHNNALSAAVEGRHIEVVGLLFDRGADPNMNGYYNQSYYPSRVRENLKM